MRWTGKNHQPGHHHGDRVQKYRGGDYSANWTTTDLGGSTTVQFSVDMPDVATTASSAVMGVLSSPVGNPPTASPPASSPVSPPDPVTLKASPPPPVMPRPVLTLRKYLARDMGPNGFGWSMDSTLPLSALQAPLAAESHAKHSV